MNEYMENLNRTPEQQLADLDERAAELEQAYKEKHEAYYISMLQLVAIKQEELNSQIGFHKV